MKEEIRQEGGMILSSNSEHAMPMIFNNLCGKNFSGREYEDYIRNIASAKWASNPDVSNFIATAYWSRKELFPNFKKLWQ